MSVEYSVKLLDYIRVQLGDQASQLLSDAEIESEIESHTSSGNRTTGKLTAYSNKFRSASDRTPVHQLTIDTPHDAAAVYRVNESNRFIEYKSGGTAPTDGDQITISYVGVKFNQLMTALFETLASSHAKLVTAQSIGGMSVDTNRLQTAFRKQAQHWAAKDNW